jgi:hypothetical protein
VHGGHLNPPFPFGCSISYREGSASPPLKNVMWSSNRDYFLFIFGTQRSNFTSWQNRDYFSTGCKIEAIFL